MRSKQKGYILAIIFVLALVMALTVTATFTLVYRYNRLAEKELEQLRADVYQAAEPTPENPDEEEGGADGNGA